MNRDSSQIEGRVRQVMADLLDIGEDEIGAETTLERVQRWDSLNHLKLMIAFEQEFGITIDIDDALKMTSFPVVCETITSYLTSRR